MSDKFPYGTQSSGHTRQDFLASCFTCGWECEARNALGLAAQHHGRTGHQVSVEVRYSVLFGPWVDEEHGKTKGETVT